MKRTDKKYIDIQLRRSNKDLLTGKVVEGMAFCDTPEQHFILTFTDGTFISIGLNYNDDKEEWVLESDWISTTDPKCVNSGRLDHWIDSDGNLKFNKWVQDLIDLGIWEVTESEVQELIEKDKKAKEEQEYKEYLRLKEKYENTN